MVILLTGFCFARWFSFCPASLTPICVDAQCFVDAYSAARVREGETQEHRGVWQARYPPFPFGAPQTGASPDVGPGDEEGS